MDEENDKLLKIEMLESAPHFSFLTFEDKNRLVNYTIHKEFLPGDFLIHEGEEQNSVSFIFEGSVEIAKTNANGDRVVIAKLGRGELIGETALLPAVYESTVIARAVEKTNALCLPGTAFRELTINSPNTAFKILYDIIKTLRKRLNEVSNKLSDNM